MKLMQDLIVLICSICVFMVLLGVGLKFWWSLFMFGWGLI